MRLLTHIKTQILLAILLILTVGMGMTGWVTYWVIDHSVSQNAFITMRHALEDRLHAIQALDSTARQAILFTVDSPLFQAYFSLPESRLTPEDAHRPILFTDQQKRLLQELKRLSSTLQNHFPAVETCLIDRLGREHLRMVGEHASENLDIHEDDQPFFQESFQLGKKGVVTTRPYFSPDHQNWVIAYTSPILLPDQSIPAFFHLEMPLAIFQAMAIWGSDTYDRYLLLDGSGLILADSAQPESKTQSIKGKPTPGSRLVDHFSHADEILGHTLPDHILNQIKSGQTGEGLFDQEGVAHQIAYRPLPFLDWRIILIKHHDHLVEGTFSYDQILLILALTPLLMLVVGAVSGERLARSLAQPLHRLSAAAQEIGRGNFQLSLPVQGNHEIRQLTESFNRMAQELSINKKWLIRAKRHTENILDAMEDIFMILSLEGVVLGINHPEPLGSDREEIIGQPASRFFLDRDFLAMPTLIEQVQESALRNLEKTLVTCNGRQIPVLLSASRMVDEDGITSGILLTAHDITHYRQIQESIRAQDLRLLELEKAASRAKSDFVANLSHEIRTPMNAILCLTDLALRANPDMEIRNHLRKVETASQSLMGCLNDILDFSKIEAGKLELYPVLFNPTNLLNTLADMFGSQAANKGIELLFVVPDDYSQTLFGDAKRLEQILVNLLRNGIKFTPQGTVIVRAHPHAKELGPVTLHFSVEDTGIGIEPDRLDTLFTPFTQADPSIAIQYGGTGLGLNICKKLVEMMGGRIWAESIPKQGSKFHFTVRVEYQSESNKVLFVPECLRNIRILVVDDHELTREIMEEILRGFKFSVTSVDSGEAAITELLSAHAMHTPYHLLFMDWRMSGMDGIETVQAIHQQFASQTPPIPPPKMVMLTAFGKQTIQQGAEESGVHLFLHKPVTRVALFNTILEVFDEQRSDADQEIDPVVLNVERETSMKIGGARVVLAEDNYINQQVASALLKRVGVTVDVANDGREALGLLETAHYDAILMDVQMPEMDGYTATRQIRQDPRFATLPIIAMTAHVLEGAREACLDSGMNDHITKPIDIRRLYTVLTQWINPDGSNLRFGRPPYGIDRPKQTTGLLPATLPGIDLQNALARLGGEELFLKSMLLRFREHAQIGDKIELALQCHEMDTARNLAHMMTGIAGNLSAIRLQRVAHDLERAIEQHRIQEEPFLLTEFHQALQQLIQTVSTLETDEMTRIQPTEKSEKKENGGSEAASLLQELSTLLELRDTDAELTMETLKKVMKRKSWHDDLVKMEEHIHGLNYPEAQKLLKKIQKNLI